MEAMEGIRKDKTKNKNKIVAVFNDYFQILNQYSKTSFIPFIASIPVNFL